MAMSQCPAEASSIDRHIHYCSTAICPVCSSYFTLYVNIYLHIAVSRDCSYGDAGVWSFHRTDFTLHDDRVRRARSDWLHQPDWSHDGDQAETGGLSGLQAKPLAWPES